MVQFSLKKKVLLLTFIPLLALIAVILVVVNLQLRELGNAELKQLESQLIAGKQEALKGFIQLSLSSVKSIYDAADADDEEAKAKALKILREISYGDNGDGYVFVFGYDGVTLANRPKPQLHGKNLLDLKDRNGVPLIRELITAAKNGGGFVEYVWAKPSKDNQDVDKLSYAEGLEKWQWMLGTGFYIDDVQEQLALANQRIEDEVAQSMTFVAVIGLGVLVISALLAWVFANSIANPLAAVSKALREIGGGDGDLSQRLDTTAKGEVGELAEGFNGFAEKIQTLIVEVKSGISELSNATLRMNGVVSNTRTDVNEQRTETEQVAAAIHQMAAAVQEVSSNATNASNSAQSADDAAIGGQNVVNETIASIQSLQQGVNSASDVISQLDKDSEHIGTVVNVIKEIADQTNLLALNAAIEAARAGEQGRGFSVVADEVRTLANRTQQSTDEIQSMIEKLQSGARRAVEEMQRSREQTNETVDKAGDTGEQLEIITSAVSEISGMSTQIATAAEEQTSVADELSRSVQHIADISERASDNADQLSSTTAEMTQLEQRLNTLVGQFKT